MFSPTGMDGLVEKKGSWEFAFHSIQRTEKGVVMTQLVVLILTTLQALSLFYFLCGQGHIERIK